MGNCSNFAPPSQSGPGDNNFVIWKPNRSETERNQSKMRIVNQVCRGEIFFLPPLRQENGCRVVAVWVELETCSRHKH